MAIELVRVRPHDLQAVSGLRQARLDQARLADPRLTFDQHDLAPPRAGFLDGAAQDRQLALATEHHVPHRARSS
jgi:hypothetical protein